MTDQILFDGPANAAAVIALAHGAGAPMDTPFMTAIAGRLGSAGIRVARFEFPYMSKRRTDGRKRGPDRAETLLETWRTIAHRLAGPAHLFIGGKSMGGRYASLFAAQAETSGIAGVICLGYPFHPAGRPDRLRIAHFDMIAAPFLIVQGERDSLGTRAEVEGYQLPASTQIVWAPDGDHSLKPRKASGLCEADNFDVACLAIQKFVAAITLNT